MTESTNYFARMLCALLLCSGLALTGCTEEPAPVAVSAITLDTNSLELQEGDSQNLTATISPSDADNKKVLWISSNSSVATVAEGVVTAVKAGQATITAKSDDGGKTATCEVTVVAKAILVESVSLDKTSVELKEGEEVSLTATVKPDNATNKNVTWSSSNETVASVTDGKVTALKSGETTITVTTEDSAKTAECKITVKGNPATATLGKVTAATATFTGHLDVPASDLSFSQVTVYYSDAETFNMNEAESASATSFDSEQNYTITLTNLKYGTKYNYCMVTEVKSEKTYGEVLDFTTDNVTLSELSVVPSSFRADVSGSLSGLSEEDKEYIKVGVIYSSESGKVENGEGKKVEVTEISAEGVFSILLSDLPLETKYYYCSYVKQGGSYTYGTPAEFTTLKHPYELTYDLNVSSATDLSSTGSANCYIISEPGLYKIKTVKGNSTTSVGCVASASILWETFGTDTAPELLDLISGICYKDGYIAFKTADNFKEGNAVIAAKDADGNILWSWHIWFTDQPQAQVYNNNAGTMMDRNLGATSATPGDVGALGLLYQWGRKDPFLGSSSISSKVEAKSTLTWPSKVSSDSSNGTIAYATANPTTFIKYNTNNEDWHYTGSSSTDNTRWTTSESSKSIYDPCPSGWRVPDGGDNGIWSKAGFDYTTYDGTNQGISFSITSPSKTWYPASGFRAGFSGSLDGVGDYGYYYRGYYWSASSPLSPNSDYAYGLHFDSRFGYVGPSSYNNRASGQSVRCLQE
ncbi:MAG: Ig-like domain-containing protein [Bacteroidales bacterium]|nr:Ig-like domain-containing protein [Bacteroidales bacterium]